MRNLKLTKNETPNNPRYVSVFFEGQGIFGGSLETAGAFENGTWTIKGVDKLTNETPDKWCEMDWNDIIFSGFHGEKEPWNTGKQKCANS